MPSPFLLPLADGVPIPGGIDAEGVDPGGIDPGGGAIGVCSLSLMSALTSVVEVS